MEPEGAGLFVYGPVVPSAYVRSGKAQERLNGCVVCSRSDYPGQVEGAVRFGGYYG